jgi:hypothetical protein
MTYPRPKHVAVLDTQTVLSRYSLVLTDTNFVCYRIYSNYITLSQLNDNVKATFVR